MGEVGYTGGMRKIRTAREWGFTGWDRRRLTQALKNGPPLQMYRRLQAVLALAQGHPAQTVAGWLPATSQAVRAWARRYLHRHCVEDLRDALRSGRPGTCRRITDRRIVREFKKDPMKLGYASTVWTVPLLAGHLRRRYECALSARTLRRRMKAIGLVWKRPRYTYSQKDPRRTAKKGALSAA